MDTAIHIVVMAIIITVAVATMAISIGDTIIDAERNCSTFWILPGTVASD